ncbi:MAG TPA: 3'-5' exonuclease, partial [Rubrivivax sp.]|nr:3'-5' exonuclease [Rubrivivax sp.]
MQPAPGVGDEAMTLWQRLTGRMGAGIAVDDQRWVVLDVESSGLDPQRDRLLSIAAVAVHLDGPRPCIAMADSFEVVLRQPEDQADTDKPNILIHRIGIGAQREGTEPAAALQSFERYVATSPLIAFHAAFDQTLILRSFDAVLGRRPPNPWLDLAPLAALARPKVQA